ncbi:CinA family protein (plasmid) [Georgenia sp. TF02-10]|uniref:CinA family protein n=1 Tax=Georgenia sp. TF02-10 TaxID=2917725 RepID=UPI001FA81140|nr:CinA family protein [Georgenia sp. TF02-10]UNX56566.1 CinA family protein [Georgenia sp. TF02-10]
MTSDTTEEPQQWEPLLDRLVDADHTVATAESLTGGRLAARLTDVPGSSGAFVGGVVTYATDAKIRVLDVPEALVDEHGVVSGECAESMANGVRDLLGTTYGISTTGVAGPDTQEGKPVGTVFVAVAGPNGTKVVPLDLDGDRERIQERAIDAALSALAVMMGESEAAPAGRGAEDPTLG